VIVYFLLKITEVAQIFGLLFPCGKRTALMLIKNGLGYFWAIFFTNSSGHTAGNVPSIFCD
jgi:hypothetical protein